MPAPIGIYEDPSVTDQVDTQLAADNAYGQYMGHHASDFVRQNQQDTEARLQTAKSQFDAFGQDLSKAHVAMGQDYNEALGQAADQAGQSLQTYADQMMSGGPNQNPTQASPGAGVMAGNTNMIGAGGMVDPNEVESRVQQAQSKFAQSAAAPFIGGPVGTSIDNATNDQRVRMSMRLGALLEGGNLQGNWAVGDNGHSFGPFQINMAAHNDITPEQAQDPDAAVQYMLPEYTKAAASVPDALWQSNPMQAARMTAYLAERPAQMYPDNRTIAAWSSVTSAQQPTASDTLDWFKQQVASGATKGWQSFGTATPWDAHDLGQAVGADPGTPVPLPQGKVVAITPWGYGDYSVSVQQPDGKIVEVGHVAQPNGLKPGQDLQGGEYVTSRGYQSPISSGPHVDVRVMQGGQYVDPMTAIGGDSMDQSGGSLGGGPDDNLVSPDNEDLQPLAGQNYPNEPTAPINEEQAGGSSQNPSIGPGERGDWNASAGTFATGHDLTGRELDPGALYPPGTASSDYAHDLQGPTAYQPPPQQPVPGELTTEQKEERDIRLRQQPDYYQPLPGESPADTLKRLQDQNMADVDPGVYPRAGANQPGYGMTSVDPGGTTSDILGVPNTPEGRLQIVKGLGQGPRYPRGTGSNNAQQAPPPSSGAGGFTPLDPSQAKDEGFSGLVHYVGGKPYIFTGGPGAAMPRIIPDTGPDGGKNLIFTGPDGIFKIPHTGDTADSIAQYNLIRQAVADYSA